MYRTGVAVIAFLVSCLLGLGLANAEEERAVGLLAETCASCHGPHGRASGSIPPLAGLSYEDLASRLAAFKAGQVPDATIMPRIVAGYSDEELAALARYYETLAAGKEP